MINNNSQTLCNFIYYHLKSKNKHYQNYDFSFFNEQLRLGKTLFNLNSYQILALCFQFLTFFPLENYKNFYYSKKLIQYFIKNIKKNSEFTLPLVDQFIILPKHAFSYLTFNRSICLLHELNFKKGIDLSLDAQILWDLNNMYLGFDLHKFLDFIDIEYNSVQHNLSENEYLFSKKNEFIFFLNQKRIFKTTIFSKKFENQAKFNLYSFIEQLNINDKIHYNS